VSVPRAPASYTPRHLAEKILASRSAIEGERKPVTVLFCDVVSSTALAERLGPEGMHGVVSRFFEIALGEVHRYEGTINQFLGDGFMALFGAALAYEDHARRAVLAALDLRRAVEERTPLIVANEPQRLELRMGLHTGFVVVGAIGDNLRMDYTAVGDTTHLAARLQQLAAPGTIVISDATARLVRGYVQLEPQEDVEVRGRSRPVSIALVTGRATHRPTLDRRDDRPLSRFVGRTRELEILRALLAEVMAGRGQVVGVVGEPGVGKSRLLLELRQWLSAGGLTYLEGRCLSFGNAIPYLPLLDVVRTMCDATELDPPQMVNDKGGHALGALGMKASAAALVTLLLGVKADDDRRTAASPESMRERSFEALRQMLVNASQHRPLMLAIEDLHWADSTSQDFLASLVETLAGAPIMLLATYRPGYRPPWMERSYATQLSLGRLTPTDSLNVVRSVLPEASMMHRVATLVLDKAEGNPFFLEELARTVSESPHGTDVIVVPDTIHDVLTARIDRLSESPRRLLQIASILGREFPARLLDSVWDGEATGPMLRELIRHEFLYERAGAEEPTYVFKHALTQDVAESTLLSQRRRDLHFRAAEGLVKLNPHREVEIAPRLAHHYFAAEAWSLAFEHAFRAAEAASAVYANREALERHDQAMSAAERAGLAAADRMRIHASRGHVHGRLGAFEAARTDFESALGLAREIGDMRACAELLGTLGELWGGHKDYQRGLTLTLEAAGVAERAGDRRALAESLVRTGLMSVNVGRVDDAERSWRERSRSLRSSRMQRAVRRRSTCCRWRTGSRASRALPSSTAAPRSPGTRRWAIE
jgi:class 3 adenylate cyclase/tetratricopeptide (TPR) repeat protein